MGDINVVELPQIPQVSDQDTKLLQQVTQELPQIPLDTKTVKLSHETNLNYMEPSHFTLYKIPKGTFLYHGTMYKRTFNPFEIQLGNDTLMAFFSPSKRLAADYISGCALHPQKGGFIHKFRVIRDIDNIKILSNYEKQDTQTEKQLENSFCKDRKLNGIGFFYPRQDGMNILPEDLIPNSNGVHVNSEFALCNPNDFLEYMTTRSCVLARKLSDEYNFAAPSYL
jgi:hypothetical protein